MYVYSVKLSSMWDPIFGNRYYRVVQAWLDLNHTYRREVREIEAAAAYFNLDIALVNDIDARSVFACVGSVATLAIGYSRVPSAGPRYRRRMIVGPEAT